MDTDLANQQIVLARMAAQVEVIHDRFDQERRIADARHADLVSRGDTRHAEVIARLDAINGRVRSAHERISEHDGLLDGYKVGLQRLSDRWHEFFDRQFVPRVETVVRSLLPTRRSGDGDGDDDGAHVSRADLRLVISVAIGSAGIALAAAFWVLRVVGKL